DVVDLEPHEDALQAALELLDVALLAAAVAEEDGADPGRHRDVLAGGRRAPLLAGAADRPHDVARAATALVRLAVEEHGRRGVGAALARGLEGGGQELLAVIAVHAGGELVGVD